jgi:hypothetical protein
MKGTRDLKNGWASSNELLCQNDSEPLSPNQLRLLAEFELKCLDPLLFLMCALFLNLLCNTSFLSILS